MDKRVADAILKLMVQECAKLDNKPDEITLVYTEERTYIAYILFINFTSHSSSHDSNVLRRMCGMIHTYFPTVLWTGQRHKQYDYEWFIGMFREKITWAAV
jgi:hypothetical protein